MAQVRIFVPLVDGELAPNADVLPPNDHLGALHLANYIARWGGARWYGVGRAGMTSFVYALGVYDDGNGPALFAGAFLAADGTVATSIAKWNGTRWSGLGRSMGREFSVRQEFSPFLANALPNGMARRHWGVD
jgi:hypothetical protein